MARMAGLGPEQAEAVVAAKMQEELSRFGQPLEGTEIRARRPGIAKAWMALADAIHASGLIEPGLRHLINRRVALSIGCEF